MRRSGTASLAILLFGSGAALAQPAPPPAACLRQDMVNGWDVVNDQTLTVTDRVGKKFTISLAPGCRNLKFTQKLAFSAFSHSGLACLGRNDFVLVPAGGGDPRQRCLIADIQAAPVGNSSHP